MGKSALLIKDRIKTICILAVRVIVRLLYVFPMKKNRVVFFSYYGKQYSCNPRAISEYLISNYSGKYEIIWAFLEPEKFNFLKKHGIKTVKYNSLKRLYLQATAKYTINNCGAFSWIPRRKNQIHVNTWHAGGAYKRLTVGTSFNRNLTAQETSHMISGCKLFTQCNIYDCFDYTGIVMPIGMPRNDIFFNKDKMRKVAKMTKEKLGIKTNDFMILYAPTWRYDGHIPQPDFDRLVKVVKERFGKNPVVVGRSHSVKSNKYRGIIDATRFPDMQDLLSAADMLITDYSSSIWDYSFTYRPCLLYVEDLDKYEHQQGFLTDIREWGFPLCRNNQELENSIINYDEEGFRIKMEKHHCDFGSYENGNATERFCKELFD